MTGPRAWAASIIVSLLVTTVPALSLSALAAGLSGPGTAVVVVGEGSSAHRNRGGSATSFSISLPNGASCPGDSRDGGYRVQSFMVPGSFDPATLVYKSIGPQGQNLYPLFDVYTQSFDQRQTANADTPGGPGRIVNIPTFDYKVIPPGTVNSGVYHIGIACTLINRTVRFWSTDIVITLSAADRPAGFTWRVANPPPSGGVSAGAMGVAFLLAALAAVAIVVVYRRRSSSVGR